LSGGGNERGAWLEVADHGAGLAPGEEQLVFNPHFRGLAARGQAGTGLGLSLARRITEQQGGTLSVSCAPGAGCRFRLSLPTRLVPGNQRDAKAAEAAR
jgi:two-component system osmolarity sensor histidine kinase EnvZ